MIEKKTKLLEGSGSPSSVVRIMASEPSKSKEFNPFEREDKNSADNFPILGMP
jgi:hypothetical protein